MRPGKLYMKEGTAFRVESGAGCNNKLDVNQLRYQRVPQQEQVFLQKPRGQPEPQAGAPGWL